ncbi:PPP6R2, partial [Cordylochernes scorpioides]
MWQHTVPQHRQYLTYDGAGYGTPSQRQQQWNKVRAAKAAENVMDYRTQKLQAGDSSLIVKDASLAREYKTAHAIERLVEDMIQQSMARGDFDNLPGAGKPLPTSPDNPYIDSTTHKLNQQVLINNGFVPEWAELGKEITAESENLRRDLLQPATSDWDSHVQSLTPRVRRLNSLIDKYNVTVPNARNQKVSINPQFKLI